MQYFIMLPGDTQEDAMTETNNLGEESLGKWIYGDGFKVLTRIVNNYPEYISSVSIFDEQGKQYEIDEFLDIVDKLKLYK